MTALRVLLLAPFALALIVFVAAAVAWLETRR